MLRRKMEIGESLLDALGDAVGGAGELHLAQLGHDEVGLFLGRGSVLLSVDRLEHRGHFPDFGRGNGRPDVPVEMHDAALPLGVRVKLGEGRDEPEALIANEKPYSSQASLLHVAQEVNPRGLVLLGPLHDAQDLAIAILVDADGHEDAYVPDLPAPGALEPDPIEENVGMLAGNRTVAPLLDLDGDLL